MPDHSEFLHISDEELAEKIKPVALYLRAVIYAAHYGYTVEVPPSIKNIVDYGNTLGEMRVMGIDADPRFSGALQGAMATLLEDTIDELYEAAGDKGYLDDLEAWGKEFDDLDLSDLEGQLDHLSDYYNEGNDK